MAGEDLSRRLRATFIQELEEQVQELNAGLIRLEQDPGEVETMRSLFRAAHTIKGAASVAGVPAVEQACHALESLFAAVRAGEHTLDGSDFALMFAVVDALTDAGARLRADEPLTGTSLDGLLPRLNAAASTSSPPPAAPDRQPEPAEPRPSAPQAPAGGAELVRVRADRLDSLLSGVGELIIATGRIVERSDEADEDARRLDGVTDRISELVRGLRLRPFADVCEALPRAVRDLAAAEGKKVDLDLAGQDVEADRIVVDALRDPLLHLVRNAIDHGIEQPEERRRAGKPETGHVRVAADLVGGRLVVTVEDDGAGIDEAAVRRALRERGQPEPRDAAELADALLTGSFSTRREATSISGRGVGVDIVRSSLERIGGTVSVDWSAGRGTRFVLECPPTPATLRALLVRVGTHLFALPTAHIERLRRVRPDDLREAEGRMLMPSEQGPIPVHSLAALLGPPLEARPIEGVATVVVTAAGSRRAALVVDEVIVEDEIVVRPLEVDAGDVPYAAGAAVLPSGRVALVLASAALVGRRMRTDAAPAFATERDAPRRRVLIADDSITTRTLEQSVLQAGGYDVITAVNGEDAWRQLEETGADAVVADVEMPRMDGFQLCRRIRGSSRFARLPIVLVTGLSSPGDRARGMEAGADAYLVKSSFDQSSLLDTVNQLIGE